eukprot:TRINITY_DN7372_c0_g1_i4.p1 TRINITY_DN7372_c0_g1~~TRINITY_DN7372_c0_g1_i4.p1  ORF type:complete len:157 (+),score=22.83 TRINITY_DN7372_c0_g1_i4:68-538(+)
MSSFKFQFTMSWIMLILSLITYLITLNMVAGKTYLAELDTEEKKSRGEDFRLSPKPRKYKENGKRKSVGKLKHKEDVGRVASSNDKFSLKLYDLLKIKKGNLLMSPFSMSAVMAMVSEGARGETLSQIMNGFSFPPPRARRSSLLSPAWLPEHSQS